MTAEAAKAHKDTIMVREGLLVTAVGAMSPQELAPLIDKAIAGLPESSETTPTPPVELNAAVSDPIIQDLPQPQSLVTFAAPAMTREDPDFYTAVVVNYTIEIKNITMANHHVVTHARLVKGHQYIGRAFSACQHAKIQQSNREPAHFPSQVYRSGKKGVWNKIKIVGGRGVVSCRVVSAVVSCVLKLVL